MSSRNDGGFGEVAAESIVELFAAAVVAALTISLTITVMLICELWRVYEDHARAGSRTGRILWIALASFGALFLVALLLATSPATQAAGAYLAAWGFLGYVIFVEVVDWRARHMQPDPVADPALSLPDVLTAWSPTPAHANGRDAEHRAG